MAGIIASWDLESGAPLNSIKSRLADVEGFINVVIQGQQAILVWSENWMTQPEAEEVVTEAFSMLDAALQRAAPEEGGLFCPTCGSYDVEAIGRPDDNDLALFRCNDCGARFVETQQ